MIKFPSLSMLTAKVREVLPNIVAGSQSMQLVDAPVDQIAQWMQREKFMSFNGMLVPVPPGLNVYMVDHLKTLTETYDVAQRLVDEVLIPIDKALAGASHQLDALTIPVGFRWKDVKFPLRHINPKDLTAQLAKNFAGPAERDARPIEKVYHSAGEIDSVYVRVNALRQTITKDTRSDINRLINSISNSAELLEEADIHPQVIKEMSAMLDVGSEWISLYGLLMKQIEDTVNCVDLTAKQLQRLYKDKK